MLTIQSIAIQRNHLVKTTLWPFGADSMHTWEASACWLEETVFGFKSGNLVFRHESVGWSHGRPNILPHVKFGMAAGTGKKNIFLKKATN